MKPPPIHIIAAEVVRAAWRWLTEKRPHPELQHLPLEDRILAKEPEQ